MNFKNKTVNQPLNAEGLLPLNLQYFAEPPAPTEPEVDPQGGSEPPATPTDPPTPENTYTQEDVNNVVARESKAAQEKLLKQLGIEDFDSAKEGMKKFQEWQESQKTEQQLKDEKLQKLEKNHSTTSEENTVLKAQISAMKAGVIAESVEDVVVLAKTLVTDDVDMDAAIAQVVEKYPHFAQAVQEENEPSDPKPQFSKGKHQKQPQSDMDKWLSAFKK